MVATDGETAKGDKISKKFLCNIWDKKKPRHGRPNGNQNRIWCVNMGEYMGFGSIMGFSSTTPRLRLKLRSYIIHRKNWLPPF